MRGACARRWRSRAMAESARPTRPVSATVSGVIELWRQSLARSWLPATLVALLWTGLVARPLLLLDPQDDLLQLATQLQELVFVPSFAYALLAVTALSVLPYCAITACVHATATGGKMARPGPPPCVPGFPCAPAPP